MPDWKEGLTFIKDPDAVKDYKFDFASSTNGSSSSDWLQSGETISTKTITASSGITVDSSSITDSNTTVTVWLSGGTAGSEYTIACKVDTSLSRTEERTVKVYVKHQ